MQNTKNMKKEIVINRMFTGKYLKDNLGHEAINLFKTDDGRHFIYLNDVGTFGKEHVEKDGTLKIDKVLLVKPIGNNAVEVVALAGGLTMCYDPTLSYHENVERQKNLGRSIRYSDGRIILAIYQGSAQQDINVTFEADKVLTPIKPICIEYCPRENKKTDVDHRIDYGNAVISLKETKMGHDLKNYVVEDTEDYKLLQTITEDSSLWADTLQKVSKETITDELPTTYMDICGASYDENAYSNAFAHFMRKYPQLVNDWTWNASKDQPFYPKCYFQSNKPVSSEFSLYREWAGSSNDDKGRADILLQCTSMQWACVIENKLLATLSDIKYDKEGQVESSQLDKYREIMDSTFGDGAPAMRFVMLLLPDYHPLLRHLDKTPYMRSADKSGRKLPAEGYATLSGYLVVKYSQVLAFLEKYAAKQPYKKDPNFLQFIDSLRRHSRPTDDGQYLDMMQRLRENL